MKAAILLLSIAVLGCTQENVPSDPWSSQLAKALSGADRVRVRTGGTCHREPATEKTLFSTSDAKLITQFVKLIAIDVEKSEGACMCCGEPTIEFYKGGKLLQTLGIQHGIALRWLDGPWNADGQLTAKSGAELAAWLTKHGVPGPDKERQQTLEQEEHAASSLEKWKQAMPAVLAPFWDKQGFMGPSKETLQEMDSTLVRAIPVEADRILALLSWFGAGESWNGYPSYEDTAGRMIMVYTSKQLIGAMEKAKMTDSQLDGAARLLTGKFAKDRPKDLKLMSKALRKQLLDYCIRTGDPEKAEWGREVFR